MVFIRDKDDHIVAGNRYKLSRLGCPAQDIIDIRRFVLPPGVYSVEVEASDLADTLDVVQIQQDILIEAFSLTPSLSDIQLLSKIKSEPDITSSLHKSGVYMEPLPFRLYYPALNHLYLYLETYQTEQLQGQPYLQYTIKPVQGDLPSPIVTFKKVKKELVTAHVFQLDIKELISGPYWLEAALFDGQKQVQAVQKIEFSRFNPKGDSIFMETGLLKLELGFVNDIPEDSLDYSMRAMAPVVSSVDTDIMTALLKKGSAKAKRYFIHRYWTNEAGKHAGPAFYSYMKVARAIDGTYRSGFGYGFETDRGHVFLKYGKPDDVITVEDEPSAPPYEIWFYNTFPATRQNNVRFLFYNPSLIKNGHKLLHSTAFNEVRNERWEVELYRDATLETPGVNERVMGDNVHRNARKYFEN
jgi:GWxTD domain-containing protein